MEPREGVSPQVLRYGVTLMDDSSECQPFTRCYRYTTVHLKLFKPLLFGFAYDDSSEVSLHKSELWRFQKRFSNQSQYSGQHSTRSKHLCGMLCFLILFRSIITCQGVTVTFGPQNQTILEGGSARFECVYEGSDHVPSWRINRTIYSNSQLPSEYKLDNEDFSLTVQNVPVSLNNTSFQCIIGIVFSEKGYLFVEPIERNTTECDDCGLSTSTSHTVEPRMGVTSNSSFILDNDRNTSYLVTSGNQRRHDSSPVAVIIGVTVFGSLSVMLFVFLIIGLLAMRHWSRRKDSIFNVSTRNIDLDIAIEENEAYAVAEKYRKPINFKKNEAYETTITVLPNRCRSPQA